MRLTNEFSWSFSRANLYSDCQKRYWYTYYGSWEGWPKTPWDKRPEIDPLARYLYAMKQMQSMPAYIGSTVHETIEYFLKKKKPFAFDALALHAKEAFLQGIDEAKGEKWRLSPKEHTNLFEYYYGPHPTEEQLNKAQQKVATCLHNWFSSPIIQQLVFHQESRWLSIEEFSSFQLAQKYKIIVVIDFAMMWRDLALLFDWKTGDESEKTDNQLYLYALYANRAWGIALDKIVLSPFYLAHNSYSKIGARQETPLDLEKLRVIEQDIEKSCEALSGLHVRQDPLEFAYTDERSKCQRCPFKELCETANYQDLSHAELRSLKC